MKDVVKSLREQTLSAAQILQDHQTGKPSRMYSMQELQKFLASDTKKISYETKLDTLFNFDGFSQEDRFCALYNSHCSNWWQVYSLLAFASYHIYFDTTYACDLKCKHCVANAGPDRPMEFLPVEAITHYIEQAQTEDLKVCHFALFGGEPTLAEIHKPGYFTTVAKVAQKTGIKLDMSTNGNWVNGPHTDYLIEQIFNIYKTVPNFLFQISVDRFHENCLRNAEKIIKKLSDRYNPFYFPDKPLWLVVHGFKSDPSELQEQCKKLSTHNVKVHPDFITGIMSAGRATKLAPHENNDNIRALITGDQHIAGNVAFAAMKPCPHPNCSKMSISLHFTPNGYVFIRDRLNPEKKYSTPIQTRTGAYRTFNSIIASLAHQIFNNYQNQIRK